MAICEWTIPDPLCCDCWTSADPAQKTNAINVATAIMHARTGRQFGPCEVKVRPCGSEPCGGGGLAWWGAMWNGNLWTPYIWEGVWYNCGCPGMCSCEPDQRIRLDGPVTDVIEVTLAGVPYDPATYRVDDYQWLIRENGERWPMCPNMNNSSGGENVLEVTYLKGPLVPADVLYATGVLACEIIKLCKGDASCQFSSRVVAMSRQGVDFQFEPITSILAAGLTGITIVDNVIQNYNPARLPYRPRVFGQAIRHPAQQTWP